MFCCTTLQISLPISFSTFFLTLTLAQSLSIHSPMASTLISSTLLNLRYPTPSVANPAHHSSTFPKQTLKKFPSLTARNLQTRRLRPIAVLKRPEEPQKLVDLLDKVLALSASEMYEFDRYLKESVGLFPTGYDVVEEKTEAGVEGPVTFDDQFYFYLILSRSQCRELEAYLKEKLGITMKPLPPDSFVPTPAAQVVEEKTGPAVEGLVDSTTFNGRSNRYVSLSGSQLRELEAYLKEKLGVIIKPFPSGSFAPAPAATEAQVEEKTELKEAVTKEEVEEAKQQLEEVRVQITIF